MRATVRMTVAGVVLGLAMTLVPGAGTAGADPACAVMQTPDDSWVGLVFDRAVGRCASPAEQQLFRAYLGGGASRRSAASAVLRSPEGLGRWVEEWYQRVLDRSADAGAVAYWSDRVRRGERTDRMEATLLASPELYAKAGSTPENWVSVAFFIAFDSVAEPSDIDAWSAFVKAGASRRTVALAMLGQPTAAAMIVGTYTYVRVLHRSDDAAGLAYWAKRYRSTGDLLDIEARFLASSEAYALAQAAG